MPDALPLYLQWGKSFPTKPNDQIKLDNPYVGQYLFKASYVNETRPDISHLLNWEYGRTWKREHKQYILKRIGKAKPKVFKPDIYARRWMLQKNVSKDLKLLIRSKKYENVQKKIENGK